MMGQLACQSVEPDPLNQPTDRHPRWRLRVFEKCWPWRASFKEALRDAVSSQNARRCPDDRFIYLDAAASIQRDPPHRYDQWRMRMIRQRS
ncbi:hypothetical protein [Sphingomonas sp. Marseille-Q8236]